MTILQPTTETKLLIDDFIQYATQHLTTVTGRIDTLSMYPTVPVPTVGPGVIIWTGYVVPAIVPIVTTLPDTESNLIDPVFD